MIRFLLVLIISTIIAFPIHAQVSTIDSDKIQIVNALGNNSMQINHDANAVFQDLYSDLGSLRIKLTAGLDHQGAKYEQYNSLNNRTIILNSDAANNAPNINLYSNQGNLRLQMHGGEDSNGSYMNFYNNLDNRTLLIDANNTGGASYMTMYSELGNLRLGLYPGVDDTGAKIELYNSLGTEMIHIDADASNNEPVIEMYKLNGDIAIKLDADVNGDSRITTDEVLINGGSDFAEQFDVSDSFNCMPGMLVSIDEQSEGKLKISNEAYDTKVVGVVSGANGVSTGLILSDEGTIADGEYPIALLGRVYVKADESQHKIRVGDLLTTSVIPGHAMKIKRKRKAQGAIIGKALTETDENGFVLVLINLH